RGSRPLAYSLGEEKRFHTAWAQNGHADAVAGCPPDAVLARPISLASYPVATLARVRVTKEVNAGPLSRRPDPVEQHRAAETNKPKLRRARFFGTHAPRDKGIPPARNAGEKARRRPRCCFGATPLVGELPRSNGQTTAWPSAPSRARKADKRG